MGEEDSLLLNKRIDSSTLPGKRRLRATVNACLSKVFFAGFFWELFGILSGQPERSALFAFATGAGDALGVGVGHAIYSQNLNQALLLATASFFTGTLWQPCVNLGLEFFLTSLVVGVVSCATFTLGLRTGRLWLPDRKFTSDLSLAISIAGAEMFFVTTSKKSPFGLFVIRDDTPLFEASCLAGTTTFLGFFFVQSIQNLAPWQLWCDES